MSTGSQPRLFPALEVAWTTHDTAAALERILLETDDFGPIALEERDRSALIFFAAPRDRDAPQNAWPHACLNTS